MIRIAAVGDIHFDRSSAGRLLRSFSYLKETADLFLIAGDLTQTGHADEGKILAKELEQCPIPVVVVFGNHDYHLNQSEKIKEELKNCRVCVLEKCTAQFYIRGFSVGIVGLKGFGGGFVGACASDFGELEMKSFIQTTKYYAAYLKEALGLLKTNYRVVLMHYSPVEMTLVGERKEIYPFLGSYLLGEAIDQSGANLVIHGHAHRGTEHGHTAKGIPVRNVAQHVIRHHYNIYSLT